MTRAEAIAWVARWSGVAEAELWASQSARNAAYYQAAIATLHCYEDWQITTFAKIWLDFDGGMNMAAGTKARRRAGSQGEVIEIYRCRLCPGVAAVEDVEAADDRMGWTALGAINKGGPGGGQSYVGTCPRCSATEPRSDGATKGKKPGMGIAVEPRNVTLACGSCGATAGPFNTQTAAENYRWTEIEPLGQGADTTHAGICPTCYVKLGPTKKKKKHADATTVGMAPNKPGAGRPEKTAGDDPAVIMQPLAGRYEVSFIPLDQIEACADNPRFLKRDSAGFTALVETIRNLGVQQPVVVRPHPTQKGMFELRAGSRRLAAARAAGLDVIPAVVRTLTDAQAREITTIENFAREELHPIEEAKAVENMEKAGYSQAQIAKRLGMSERWVARRRSLLNLSANWMNTIKAGDLGDPLVRRFSARHFEAIARFPQAIQDQYLDEEIRNGFGLGDFPTEEDLERDLANLMHNLSAAPFDIDDASLDKKAGACTACPKRSSRNPLLFDTPPAPEGGGKKSKPGPVGDACLDELCWNRKVKLTISATAKAVKSDTGKSPMLVGDSFEAKRAGIIKDRAEVIESHSVERCKESAAGAVPAVLVTGAEAGRAVWVKPATRQRYQASGAPVKKEKVNPREVIERRRRRDFVAQLQAELEALKPTDLHGDYITPMVCLHLASATAQNWPYGRVEAGKFTREFKRFYEGGPEAIKAGLLKLIIRDLHHNARSHCATPGDVAITKGFADALDLGWGEIEADVAAEHPLPGAKKAAKKTKGKK